MTVSELCSPPVPVTSVQEFKDLFLSRELAVGFSADDPLEDLFALFKANGIMSIRDPISIARAVRRSFTVQNNNVCAFCAQRDLKGISVSSWHYSESRQFISVQQILDLDTSALPEVDIAALSDLLKGGFSS